jgi:hypothetical protein
VQVALEHACLGPHALPHAPQFAGSRVRSVQNALSQHVSSGLHALLSVHDSAHWPFTQCPLRHDEATHGPTSGDTASVPES